MPSANTPTSSHPVSVVLLCAPSFIRERGLSSTSSITNLGLTLLDHSDPAPYDTVPCVAGRTLLVKCSSTFLFF
jgi:hypothetical protein